MEIRLTKLDSSGATIESTGIKSIMPCVFQKKEVSLILLKGSSELVAESPEEVIAAIKEAAKQRAIEIAQEYAESDDPEVYSVYMPPAEENGLM